MKEITVPASQMMIPDCVGLKWRWAELVLPSELLLSVDHWSEESFWAPGNMMFSCSTPWCVMEPRWQQRLLVVLDFSSVYFWGCSCRVLSSSDAAVRLCIHSFGCTDPEHSLIPLSQIHTTDFTLLRKSAANDCYLHVDHLTSIQLFCSIKLVKMSTSVWSTTQRSSAACHRGGEQEVLACQSWELMDVHLHGGCVRNRKFIMEGAQTLQRVLCCASFKHYVRDNFGIRCETE